MKINSFLQSALPEQPFYALFGNPVGHSMSPLIHNRALQFHSLRGSYHAIEVAKDQIQLIEKVVRHPNFKGANVTIPYKQDIQQFLNQISETSQQIGAVNTVVRSGDALLGYNTDVDGFIQPLKLKSDSYKGESAVIFGAGGAAKAVVYGLLQLGFDSVCVVSRNPQKLNENAWFSDGRLFFKSYQEIENELQNAKLIVNTTPLGMHPNISESPFPTESAVSLKDKICYDIVYNPLKTRFLMDAEEQGAEIIDGLGMFVGQASVAFKLWTGFNFPDHEIYHLLKAKITAKNG